MLLLLLEMRTSELILIAALMLVLIGGTGAVALLDLPSPQDRNCESETNDCYLKKVKTILSAPGLQFTKLDRLFPILFNLCSYMSDSNAKDECYSSIAVVYGGEKGHHACAMISFRPIRHKAVCSYRQAQVLLEIKISEKNLDSAYEELMALCAESSDVFRDLCYFEIALHYKGDQAREACYKISMAKFVGDEITRQNCLTKVESLSA